jgi:predicted Rossmann-fold nucleotide-binding protein
MLYISGDLKYLDCNINIDITNNIDESKYILILPGGLGTYYDLFKGIKDNKIIYLYNKDYFYTPIIKNLYDLYINGVIDKVPSEYINIESNILDIVKKLEECK